jgi:cytochrome c biogenesis protein CcmG/thiol:disulfide interchange protein DsbE
MFMRKIALLLTLVSLVACGGEKKGVTSTVANDDTKKTAATAPPLKPEATTSTAAEAAAVGTKMPAYSSAMLDGKKFDIAGERGKVVLLNVWATWCGPCRFEIPDLEVLHKENSAKGFEVVGVSVDESGADAVRSFVTEQKMTYPIVLDAEGTITNLLQTTVLPTSVLIDRNGTIVWKHFGLVATKDATFQKALTEALAQKKG